MPKDSYMGPGAPALTRGLGLLERIVRHHGPVTFSELVARSGIPRATVIRLLGVLRHGGWIERRADGYRPGPRCRRLNPGAPTSDVEKVAESLLADVVVSTGCSAIVFTWNPPELTAVAKRMHPAAPSMQDIGHRTTARELRSAPWWWLLAWQGHIALRADIPRSGTARRFWAEHRVAYDDCRVIPFVRRLAAALVIDDDAPPLGFLALGGNALILPDRTLSVVAATLAQTATVLSARLRA